jgi:hypothetical protein
LWATPYSWPQTWHFITKHLEKRAECITLYTSDDELPK